MLGRERVDAFCEPSGPLLPLQNERDSFRPLERSTNEGDAMNKFYMTVVVVLAASIVLPACGGRQRPPENGTCNAGRRWVAPHDEGGQRVDGHCETISE